MKDIIQDLEILDSPKTEEKESCGMKISENTNTGKDRKLYIESYGCQMNFSDSEIVSSIMEKNGFDTTNSAEDADVIFLNTCSIREKAEATVRKRLTEFNKLKRKNSGLIVGMLGCMAERLKAKLLEEEKIVDMVVGPDAYRSLPELVNKADDGQKAINTILSTEETYADISPVRLNSNGVTAFISIMRGCDNMCSFCVVPFTRGRERSRDPKSIVKEAQDLFDRGYKEVTLLGQNVDSYKWAVDLETNTKKKIEKSDASKIISFANLLEMVAQVSPSLRVRFSTSHPKDITNEVLYTIKKYDNICKCIHLPVQSGSTRILDKMNRTYSREEYIERIDSIRRILGPDCSITSDMIIGFCSETEGDHEDTLSLIDYVQYDFSYMFYYSERPGTLAAKKYQDDVSLEIKKRRLSEVIKKQREYSTIKNNLDIGKIFEVLVEGVSKRSEEQFQGRNTHNKVIVFDRLDYKVGDYVMVEITNCTGGTLIGKPVEKQD